MALLTSQSREEMLEKSKSKPRPRLKPKPKVVPAHSIHSWRRAVYGEDYLGEKAFKSGWYDLGGEITPNKYLVENLVRHWRGEMILHFGFQCPALYSPQPWFRPKLLEWLRAEGYRRCEAAVSYAVGMWEPLRERFEIECEFPYLNVILGFHKSFGKEMEHVRKKAWGAHWTGDSYSAESVA
jgi:hypothetical protein